MKKLLIILGSLAIVGSSAVTTVAYTKHDVISQKNNVSLTTKKQIDHKGNKIESKIQEFEDWHNNLTIAQQQEAYQNYMSALIIDENNLFLGINIDKLDKDLFSNNILKQLQSQNYYKSMDKIDVSLYLNDSQIVKQQLTNRIFDGWQVWTEAKWYWFGWWKLCFNDQASKDIANFFGSTNSDAIGATGDILEAASKAVANISSLLSKIFSWSPVFLGVVIAFLQANAWIFEKNNDGNGIWIGFFGIIPYMGWGSN
ncbi:hypothetical protein [Williamsoniiplasma lucivorax]|uniref:Uncharacterized protein n=1 Tax=Williamsoniiplasma lucivorax TaxID=209274 RepID=A0A2S5RDF7_9MOLU|nr:hypothetical protein [Williamsoniiplasma lucivorax]PPE05379.1 hypothetical protein ELUCI_v1c04710 [Williamsoniiplasma lucivorax]